VPVKRTIRREVQRLTKAILRRTMEEFRCSQGRRTLKAQRIETLSLRQEIRLLLESFEDIVKVCDTPFCKKVSLIELRAEIYAKVRSLLRMDKNAQRMAIKACCNLNRGCSQGAQKTDRMKSRILQILSELPDEKCD
jgi:hypothetical protein